MKMLILLTACVFASPLPIQAQWQLRGFVGRDIFSLLTNGSVTYAGGDSGCYRSSNDGLTWERRSNGLPVAPAFTKTLAIAGASLFAGTNAADGVYLTTNEGETWSVAGSGLTGTGVHALLSVGNRIFAGTNGNGVFQSTDNGETWQPSSNGLTSLAVHSLLATQGRVFAGTETGVFVSTDSGGNWSLPLPGPIGIRSLAVNGAGIFAATNSTGVFKSTDTGTTWTAVNDGLTDSFVRVIISQAGNLFAGTRYSGVFLSTSGGNSWSQINDGLDSVSVLSLAVNSTILYAGMETGGVWTRPLSQVVDVGNQHVPLNTSLRLEQNYPNPFNPVTTIVCQVAVAGHVRLVVYDERGGTVATLMDKVVGAGSYSTRWDASTVASGVYFYRLESGTSSATKRLMILK